MPDKDKPGDVASFENKTGEGVINDPTRVGVSRMAYLATRVGLKEDADGDAIAVAVLKAMEKAGGQVDLIAAELDEVKKAAQAVLESNAVVHATVATIGEKVGMKPKDGSIAILTVVNRQLGALTDEFDRIRRHAACEDGVRAAIRIMAGLSPQVAGKNPPAGKAVYEVKIPEADALKLDAIVGNLSRLEAVCVGTSTPAADKKG